MLSNSYLVAAMMREDANSLVDVELPNGSGTPQTQPPLYDQMTDIDRVFGFSSVSTDAYPNMNSNRYNDSVGESPSVDFPPYNSQVRREQENR